MELCSNVFELSLALLFVVQIYAQYSAVLKFPFKCFEFGFYFFYFLMNPINGCEAIEVLCILENLGRFEVRLPNSMTFKSRITNTDLPFHLQNVPAGLLPVNLFAVGLRVWFLLEFVTLNPP